MTLFRRWMTRAQHDIDDGGEIRPAAVRFQHVATDEERRALRLERLHDDIRQRRELRRRVRQRV